MPGNITEKDYPLPLAGRLPMLGDGLKVQKVLGARLLLKPAKVRTKIDELEEKGLLYAPNKEIKDRYAPSSVAGEILMAGDRIERKEELTVGTAILFGKFSADQYMVDGEAVYLIREEDVMCILDLSPELVTKEKP